MYNILKINKLEWLKEYYNKIKIIHIDASN